MRFHWFSRAALAMVVCAGVIICWRTVYSEDQSQPTDTPVREAATFAAPPAALTQSSTRDGESPAIDLQQVWSEVRALRADMQKVLDLLATAESPTALPPAAKPIPHPQALDRLPQPRPTAAKQDEKVSLFKIESSRLEEVLAAVRTVVIEGHVIDASSANEILVIGSPAELQRAAEVIQKLDRLPQQVRITCQLYEIPVSDLEALGLDSDTPEFGELVSVSRPNIVPILAALAEAGRARLVAYPTVIASDQVEATFQAVSEIPVQELTTTDQGGVIGTTSFREVGITLQFLPRIRDNDSIQLDVTAELSKLNGFSQGQPIIDRRVTATTMRIKDAETVAISGLPHAFTTLGGDASPATSTLQRILKPRETADQFQPDTELLIILKTEIIPSAN